MDLQQLVDGARDTLTVRRVFGEPYEREGVTVIPVAKVQGGGGGGQGEDEGAAKGSGGGFGMSARPAGLFVLSGGRARWQPAVDVNKVVAGAQIVAVVALLTVRSILRLRLAAQRGRKA